MFDRIAVNPRIAKRHPEITAEDVAGAWANALVYAERITGSVNGPLLVAVGFDGRGRLLEMVAVADETSIHVFHAMTPPSKKTMRELGME